MWRIGRRDADRGVAMVEFALVMPLFVLVLCGIIDFSRAFHVQLTLSDAAAEGARTLATLGALDKAQSDVDSLLAPMTVSYSEITECPDAAISGSIQARMTVTTTNFRFITPGIEAMFSDMAISGTAARRCSS